MMLINYLLFIMKSYTEYTQKTHKTEKNPNQSKQTCLQTRLNQLAAKKLTSHFYFLIKYIYCLCCAKVTSTCYRRLVMLSASVVLRSFKLSEYT